MGKRRGVWRLSCRVWIGPRIGQSRVEMSSSAKRLTIETMSVLRTDLSLRLRGVTRVFRFNINVNTTRGRRAPPGGGGAVSSVRCETIILHTRLPFSSEDEDHPASPRSALYRYRDARPQTRRG